jgi:isopentenyldiphosphate isomerase
MVMAEELFDIYDDQGTHIGVKPRGEVHRDGDWHKSMHLWIISSDGMLVMQRRADDKDSCPGMFDASVGGHLVAGEKLVDALREADEELGAIVGLQDTVNFGVVKMVAEPHPGFVNRELCTVLVLVDDRPLPEFRFCEVEISALAKVPAAELEALLAGRVKQLQVEGHNGVGSCELAITREDVVLHDYLPDFLSFVQGLLDGRK